MCIMRMQALWLARVFCTYDLEPRVFFPIFVTSAQLKGRINRDFFRVSLC